jgi:SAM-dependent methyltransferase
MSSSATLSSYDLVPYESYPFAHLHPARMAATAQLRGMQPPPVATARVLDLGCGSGGHVIALAGFYPQMQLIGVDLAEGQIALGNQRIRDLGLTNVSLYAADLGHGLPQGALDAAQAFGSQFDYIVCQGVYYVVPDAVRSAIWQLLRKHLAPRGMAHISFNTYPGWKQREIAQDFAQFHAQSLPQASGTQREQAVREALAQIAALAPQNTEGLTAGYGLSLQAEAQAAARALPGLLFHEFLSGDNRPLYFSDMLSAASQAGFAYLCETSLPDAWPGRLGAAAAPLLAAAGGEALRLEQYIDFTVARTYRNSLWIAPTIAAALPSPLQAWPPQALRGLHIAVDLQAGLAESAAQEADQQAGQQAFVSTHGIGFTVSQAHAPALQALLRAPGLQGPQDKPLWQSADALLDAYPASADLLHECVLRGLLSAWREPPDTSHLQPMQMPAWLRKEAVRSASVYLPSIWHQPVGLSPAERQLIAQLDGRFMPDAAFQASIARFAQLGWLRT